MDDDQIRDDDGLDGNMPKRKPEDLETSEDYLPPLGDEEDGEDEEEGYEPVEDEGDEDE